MGLRLQHRTLQCITSDHICLLGEHHNWGRYEHGVVVQVFMSWYGLGEQLLSADTSSHCQPAQHGILEVITSLRMVSDEHV